MMSVVALEIYPKYATWKVLLPHGTVFDGYVGKSNDVYEFARLNTTIGHRNDRPKVHFYLNILGIVITWDVEASNRMRQ